MKLFFISIMILLNTTNLLAQDINQLFSKYISYRERLKENFVSIGPRQGQSLIVAKRTPGKIYFGDAGAKQGWYLAVLATEYVMFKYKGISTDATVEEIYYALNAINRLDASAEKLYGGQDEQLNGFFIRDDADESLLKFFPGINEIKSDFLSSKKTDNEMSQDQLIGIIFGLAVLKRSIPISENYQGQSLVRLAMKITERLYNFISQNSFEIVNPVTKKLVARGPDVKAFSLGLNAMVEYIMQDENDFELKKSVILSDITYGIVKYPIVPKFFNRGMVLITGSVGNIWGNGTQLSLKMYDCIYNKEIYLYLHKYLHSPKIFLGNKLENIHNLLATAPNEGPHWKNRTGWSSWNRFYQPKKDWKPRNRKFQRSRREDSKEEGYAGLDYMLLHNLFQLEMMQKSMHL